MEFKEAYETWLKDEIRLASSEGRNQQRLVAGLGPAEQKFATVVWWPAFRNFRGLHPEYAVRDFKDGYRYIDFAYIERHFRVAIEIDGFETHGRDLTPEQFCDHCERQNDLVIDKWHVIRFPAEIVKSSPRHCQQKVQQLLGSLSGDVAGEIMNMGVVDREILYLVFGRGRPVTVAEVASHVKLSHRVSIVHLKKLVALGWIEPARGGTRIHEYRVHHSRSHVRL